MGELHIKDKDIAVPGEIIATGMDFLPAGGAFRDNDVIIASQVGMVNVDGRLVKVVPLNTIYVPKRGDIVIGRVTEITLSAWFVDIGVTTEGIIPLMNGSFDYIARGADLSQYFTYGDYVVANVMNLSRGKQPELTMKGPGLRKLNEGRVIHVNPAKIPRVIGKQGSMVSMIKQKTDCRIIAGQNGVIWVSGVDPEKEQVAVEAIQLIEENAHHSGLTDDIQKFLETKMGK